MSISDLINVDMESPRRVILTFRTAAAAEQFIEESALSDVAQGAEAVAWRWEVEVLGVKTWQYASHWSTGPKGAQPLYAAPPVPPALTEDARDAARYRWIRDQGSSLETRQRDKGVINGPSCYHEVEGIRELKWGDSLDEAIDAALTVAQSASGDAK